MASAEAQGVVKVTPEQLGINVGEEYEGQLEFDLGNLSAFDPAPVDPAQFEGKDRDEVLRELARGVTQSLSNQLFALPGEAVQGGRLARLPRPSTVLPRFKPLPKPKAMTKWQKFAQQKGITKRKRSKLLFDEGAGEWKRRHGYNKANDDSQLPIIEAKSSDKPGEDPFAAMQKAKKERVKKNRAQQLENAQNVLKEGGSLPTTLRLAAQLGPRDSQGEKGRKRKHLKDEIKGAHLQAGVSTASMGKFDRRLQGEKDGERAPMGKRRKFLDVTDTAGERTKLSNYADKFIRERADDIIDLKKAIGKFEADAREERHDAKSTGGGGGGGRGGKGGPKGGRGGSRGGKGAPRGAKGGDRKGGDRRGGDRKGGDRKGGDRKGGSRGGKGGARGRGRGK